MLHSTAPLQVVVADMRITYDRGGLTEEDVLSDPLKQWDAWFKQAVAEKVRA